MKSSPENHTDAPHVSAVRPSSALNTETIPRVISRKGGNLYFSCKLEQVTTRYKGQEIMYACLRIENRPQDP